MKDFAVLEFLTQNKGSLKATITVLVPAWGNFVISGITYFEKDGRRWINLPKRWVSQQSESSQTGEEIKWEQIVYFQENVMMTKFSEKVLAAIDSYLKV